jgi:hypothetical protein
MKDRVRIALAILAIGAGLVCSYALATGGEPQSHWLWHNVMGVVR